MWAIRDVRDVRLRANFRYASLNRGRSSQKRHGIVKTEFVKTLRGTLSMNPCSVADISTNTLTTVHCFYNLGIKGLAWPSDVKSKFVGFSVLCFGHAEVRLGLKV